MDIIFKEKIILKNKIYKKIFVLKNLRLVSSKYDFPLKIHKLEKAYQFLLKFKITKTFTS